MFTSIVCWIVLGLIAGFVASKIVNGRGEGVPQDIALGIVGAVIGGWLFNAIGIVGATGFISNLFVAVVGAIVLLVLWHALRGRISRA